MRPIFLLFFLLPVFTLAQKTPVAKSKTVTKPKTAVASQPAPAQTGFTISGEIAGYADGTIVDLINGGTSQTEASTTLMSNKFFFKGGNMSKPDFKIILINKQAPYITLFLDNSNVKIVGSRETLDRAKVTGSKSHADFEEFNTSLNPYQSLFAEDAEYDAARYAQARKLIEDYVAGHKESHISTLAILRYNQLAEDPVEMEPLYKQLAPDVQGGILGKYIAQMILEARQNGVGTLLPDFSQPDTSGTMVSLSSLRGKYVLVDFWASWCKPCRMENPNLVAAYNKYRDKNFTVFGVSLDQAREAWISAIKMDSLNWTQVSDLKGWGNAVAQQFQISSIPQNFLLDPEGKVVGKNLRGRALERKLERLLK